MTWAEVQEALPQAKAITWDECHKIYILLDEEQVVQFTSLGYDPIIAGEPGQMLEQVCKWYADSCHLRFVSSVRTNHADPNAGYTSLIAQGEEAQ